MIELTLELYNTIRNCRLCPNVIHGVITEEGDDGSVLFVAIQPSWKGHHLNPYPRKDIQRYFDEFWELKKQCRLGQYRFTNFVKCATDNASEYPPLLEILNCLHFLEDEVKEFQAKLIVVVGKDRYPFWKDYLEQKLGVATNYCLHYGARVSNQPNYLPRQTARLEDIREQITELGI